MNRQNDDYPMRKEAEIRQQLEELKSRVTQLHHDIACLKQCSRLNDLLQKIYETRVGLNQLEQDLLQTHLKCCISPNIKIPGEVVLALSRLSEKRHGMIIAIEHADDGLILNSDPYRPYKNRSHSFKPPFQHSSIPTFRCRLQRNPRHSDYL